MGVSTWFKTHSEAIKRDWEKSVSEAVQRINRQNWIRYEITQWTIRFEASEPGKIIYVYIGKEGINVHITITALKDKYKDTTVPNGSLTENDKLLAGYLGLLISDKDYFSDWTFRSEVKISPDLFSI